MPQVLVRQVDEAIMEALKRKASARGTSLESYVRDMMARDAAETRAQIVARLKTQLASQPRQTSNSTDFIRSLREGEDEGDVG